MNGYYKKSLNLFYYYVYVDCVPTKSNYWTNRKVICGFNYFSDAKFFCDNLIKINPKLDLLVTDSTSERELYRVHFGRVVFDNSGKDFI